MILADKTVAAFQVCSNQTSNMLANWKCSYDVAHPSTVQTGGGPAAMGHAATPALLIGIVVVVLLVALVSRRRRPATASR